MELKLRDGAVWEGAREIPVVAETEVLVVGGGSAGWSSAVAAARQGARTMLIERYGFLGGAMTMEAVGCICGLYTCSPNTVQVVHGLAAEFTRRLEILGGGFKRLHRYQVDHEIAKTVLDQMCLEAGVRLQYHTLVVDTLTEVERVRGVVIESKAGRQAVLARVIVDASGDGDVAVRAGAPWEKGDAEGNLQAPTLIIVMGNVDVERAMAFPERELRALQERAIESGEFPLPRVSGSYSPLPTPGKVHVNMTRVHGVDATDPVSMTRGEIEARRQALMYIEFLKRHVPGFERAAIDALGPQLGIRETRRIMGEYALTGEDVLGARKFGDGITKGAWPVEIHEPKGKDTVRLRLPGDDYYHVPYRCLVPLGVEDLLVAGRCLSATREGHASARVMGICMGMGQAAGTAAALCAREGTAPRRVDGTRLQRMLIAQGADLP